MSRRIDLSGRPRIGVTGPDRGGDAAWWFTRFAVWRAGGRARRVTPARPVSMDELDGLILGGGADVDPALYGREAPSVADVLRGEAGAEEADDGERGGADRGRRGAWSRRLVSLFTLGLRRLAARKSASTGRDPDRDALEVELLRAALDAGRPVLGICRGAQLLNVHCGGTLHQELGAFYEETPQVRTVRPLKRVEIAPGSLLARILRTPSCRVNALHNQAVDRLAEDLRIVAREPNGVVQAIEHSELPYLLGVQWHPEYLPQVRRQRRIFEHLVDEARAAASVDRS